MAIKSLKQLMNDQKRKKDKVKKLEAELRSEKATIAKLDKSIAAKKTVDKKKKSPAKKKPASRKR